MFSILVYCTYYVTQAKYPSIYIYIHILYRSIDNNYVLRSTLLSNITLLSKVLRNM